MATSLFAREVRGRSQLEGGSWGLGSGSIDEVSEDLSLFEEKVEPLHSVLDLRRWVTTGGLQLERPTSFWSYSPEGSLLSGLVRLQDESLRCLSCCCAAATSGGT